MNPRVPLSGSIRTLFVTRELPLQRGAHACELRIPACKAREVARLLVAEPDLAEQLGMRGRVICYDPPK
jgi:hypothetical protein